METTKTIESAIGRVVDHYRDNGFSRTTVFTYKKLCRELLEHLAKEGLQGSEEDLRDWLKQKLIQHESSYRTTIKYYRYVHLLLEELSTDDPDYGHVGFLRVAKTPSTESWRQILDGYLSELEREEKAKATIDFSRRACTKFILHLERQGCLCPTVLSRELVLSYQNESGGHSSLNGKRAYLYRIRMFIRYLQRKGMVEPTLEFAVNTRYRIHRKVVTTLDEEQRLQIHGHKKTNDPFISRSYAMATLALYLGLRSSDIIRLRFGQISWIQNTITVIQQKTKATQVLPLTAVVGNAIADYVVNHRPESKSPYVFVSHRPPFGQLTRIACYCGSIALLGDASPKGTPKGLHVMRRTFATGLLRSQVKHELVSSILGHSSPESISPYLSLDEERMARCALDLSLVGKPGVS